MHKSILVLEESRMVHELFESALPDDFINWEVTHEILPDRFLQKANETDPDIIFLSNLDQKRDYATVKQLKSSPVLSNIPILLLTSAKDKLDENLLRSIGVRGFVRKPFETSTLHKQISIVLQEQERGRKSRSKNALQDLNVVDDDLMGLLKGKSEPDITIDELEGELDPTLELLPDDNIEDEEFAETELMSMDDSDDFDQSDFIDETDDLDDGLNLDDDDEMTLEELDEDSPFEELENEQRPLTKGDTGQAVRTILVKEAESARFREPLQNIPEHGNDLGFIELHVIPYRTDHIKSNVIETISDDFDENEFVRSHAPLELDQDFIPDDEELEIDSFGEDGEIEIPHEEIVEDFQEDENETEEEAIHEEGLLELSIEGMEEEWSETADDSEEEVVAFEELEDSEEVLEEINIHDFELQEDSEELEDDVSLIMQDGPEENDQDFLTVEQEEEDDVEIDFQSSPMEPAVDESDEEAQTLFGDYNDAIDDESLTDSERESRRSNQLDIDLEEIAAAGSEEASSTIQEMIGFRQVMKAKYDLPDSDLGIEPESDNLDDDFEGETGDDEDLLSDVEDSMGEDEDLLSDVEDSMGEDEDFDPEAESEADLMLEEPDDLLMEISDNGPDEDLDLLASDSGDIEEGDELLAEDDILEDVDLLSEVEEEESPVSTDVATSVLDDSEDDPGDSLFEDPEDLTMAAESEDDEDEDEDEIFSSPGEDPDTMDDPIDLFDDEEDELTDDSAESFEEIVLMTDEGGGFEEENEHLLQVDEEPDEDIDTFVIDEDDDLEDDEPDDGAIDFIPVDEEEEEDEIEISVTINDSDEPDLMADESEADELDTIDFLPVDEDEISADEDDELELANHDESLDESSLSAADIDFELDDSDDPDEMEEIPILAAEEDLLDDDALSDDIDFMPLDADEMDDQDDLSELESDDLDQDIPPAEIGSIDDADEIMIEVPQETFEMSDFNVSDLTEDEESNDSSQDESEGEYDLMNGIETVRADDKDDGDDSEETTDSYDNLELPTMDEDLPDLPPITDDGEDEEELQSNGSDPDTDSIELMQNGDDFEAFDSEQEIIGVVENPENSFSTLSTSDREKIKQQAKLANASFTPEFGKRLSDLIEGVVSETVHNTLQEKLPDMVAKLMNEEMGD